MSFQALEKLKENPFKFQDASYTAVLVDSKEETEVLKKMEADKNARIYNNLLKQKNKSSYRKCFRYIAR